MLHKLSREKWREVYKMHKTAPRERKGAGRHFKLRIGNCRKKKKPRTFDKVRGKCVRGLSRGKSD